MVVFGFGPNCQLHTTVSASAPGKPTALTGFRRYSLVILCFLSVFYSAFYSATSCALDAESELSVAVADQELLVQRFSAKGEQLLLWVAPSWGSKQRTTDLSRQLAGKGIEVWHVDLLESLFLQRSTSAMRKLSGEYVASLIEFAHAKTGKRITLLSRSYGAVPVLRGARVWQLAHPGAAYLRGAIIFSPDLYAAAPALGLTPEYLSITEASNINIGIFQGTKRGNRWQLDALIDRLQRGGAHVYVNVLRDVNSVFFEPTRTGPSDTRLQRIGEQIQWMVNLFDRLSIPKTGIKTVKRDRRINGHLDVGLKTYRANPSPLSLKLKDAGGKWFERQNYSGKVTVINFWATWCRPCVKEIPSLNNLRKQMRGKPFELISVNYAEPAGVISAFLQEVNVDFPVLLDETGRVSADWNVVVFPSTFVIAPDGKIVYGVNAGIEWDTPEVITKLLQLMPTK